MGKYIGVMQQVYTYYNFKPLIEIESNGSLSLMDDKDRERILPNSVKGNINIYYSVYDDNQSDRAKEMFENDRILLFEFEPGDLQDNLYPDGRRNPTGYKISFLTATSSGKLRPLHTEDIFFVLHRNDLLSDFRKTAIVQLEKGFYGEGDKVFIEEDGIYAGPYKVGLRRADQVLYIKPSIQSNKYTLKGFKRKDCRITKVKDQHERWGDDEYDEIYSDILTIKKNSEESYIDIISDQQLLDGFKDSVSTNIIQNGKVDLNQIEDLISNYKNSELSGSILPIDIQESRHKRLLDIFSSAENENTTLANIADIIAKLLLNHRDNESIELLLGRIISSKPDFINNLQSSKFVQEHKEQKEAELAELQAKIEEARQKNEELQNNIISKESSQLRTNPLNEILAQETAELNEIAGRLGIASEIDGLNNHLQSLKEDVKTLEHHKAELSKEVLKAENSFTEIISKYEDRMVDIAFDGFVAHKLTKAAAEWESLQNEEHFNRLIEEETAIKANQMDRAALVDYLCNTIQMERPHYSRNFIINVLICISQGFLTVFSGEPGCGKTSFCKIIGKSLGLTKIHNYLDLQDEDGYRDRFIIISVERGWTSKRDLVGYYNPLSQTFDQSNQRIYEALKLLDREKKNDIAQLPYIILLDEANLSPMEYYWADFMNICDDLDENSFINLGEKNIFGIPETLRFLATINNDHTTEILSPRLIDRAWVITLPRTVNITAGNKMTHDVIQLIRWDDIKTVLGYDNKPLQAFSPVTQKIYDGLIALLKKQKTIISARSELAIRRYWTVASNLMEKDELDIDPSVVALDYAVAQKILPKIQGSGDQYRDWLNDLLDFFENNYFTISSRIIEEIIERGDAQMKYYQFFN